MRKLNYKIIVSDFDGTLLTDDQKVPDKVRKAINEYVENGGIFAVCTGRMLCSILPKVRELGLKGLVVAHQGAQIAEIDSGKVISEASLTPAQTYEICGAIQELGHSVNVFSGDMLYTNIPKDNEYLKLYESIIGVDTHYVENIGEFVLKNNLHCQKTASLVAQKQRNELYSALSGRFKDKYDVTCSAKVLVEISPAGVTKGKALEYLCSHFNVPIRKSVAIGDNLNDITMIKCAGIGVAVGNADISLKNEADFIATTNNDGAVAQIIEKYGFA